MARPPKPLAISKRHNTKEEIKRREEAEAAIKLDANNLQPPAWLTGPAVFIFKRIVEEGAKINLFDNLDIDALAKYADLTDKMITLKTTVDREGFTLFDDKGREYANPAYTAYIAIQTPLMKLSSSLGLTSIERLKLTTAKEEKPKNKFADILQA